MTKPNPAQPKKLPQEVYTRRRVAALVVILVVVALFIWAVTSLFGGSGKDNNADSVAVTSTTAPQETSEAAATSETSQSTESSESSEAEESAKSSESEKASEPSTPLAADAKRTCELADLQITAMAAEDTFAPGALPVFYMRVHNPTAADCVINLDENQLRFEVYGLSTNARMWADTDCYPAVETGEQVFKSNSDRNFKAEWSRRTSKPGQCTDRQEAPTGGYYVHAVLGDNPSAPTPFNLA
ncbi:hypothetical protein ACTXN7_02475 [Corynebacterium flavescens]|uniref:Uncharacterized protein n=1 Tax=Corynebacterium flavescens TaxID=28028 RepID=A0A1L7CP64_CORFL|nr:hypothetical protein [Corynebacterium flavescens]APT87634.1 hypothetical protein CFLV_11035 [Corynebacterium flavescens]KAA8720023.1 hypothetical protein F4V60_10675 [Corynebacterium flavescens]GEB96980.1 hypothetical protein CFL01nite_04750 [Corynebacterium flavescens]